VSTGDYPQTLLEFERRFPTDAECRAYLTHARWPEGFVCPRCGAKDAWPTRRHLFVCTSCRHHTSVTAGTIMQDTRLPLTLWFRAMWLVTNWKSGMSALGLQRALGIGSYRSAWTMLQKLRRAMVRPGRDRLRGTVEGDEAFWGAREEGAGGRLAINKVMIVVAAEVDGRATGRIRMARIPDATREHLHRFIVDSIEPGSVVRTDGLQAYRELDDHTHQRLIQWRATRGDLDATLPRAHRAVSLLKRWLMGTHQGAIGHQHLDGYLNEFVFRFNRRTSKSRGLLFRRLVEHCVLTEPAPYELIVRPLPVGGG
jgi:transposase-like protein